VQAEKLEKNRATSFQGARSVGREEKKKGGDMRVERSSKDSLLSLIVGEGKWLELNIVPARK